MKEQKELEAEAAEEGKAPGVPQPQSSMYDSTFAQVTFGSRPYKDLTRAHSEI